MTGKFRPNLATGGIGSLPFTDCTAAAGFVVHCGLDVPFWPQLPKRCFREQMIPQYASGMPAVTVDAEGETLRFDAAVKYDALTAFYARYLDGGLEDFAIPEEDAAGFNAFLEAARGGNWQAVKGQVTGPITFATGILNDRKDTLYADPDLRDAAIKLLARKAQWQVGKLKSLAETVIVFVDEPVLAALGSSAYVGISDDDVIGLEKELFEAIRAEGGTAGIHVCGNSDWGVMIRTGVDVLNFDAHQYGPRLALYASEVRGFLDRDGVIAWGLVPTTEEELSRATTASLAARFRANVRALTDKGIPESLILERSMLTPCCGCGSLDAEGARKVFEMLRELRDILR